MENRTSFSASPASSTYSFTVSTGDNNSISFVNLDQDSALVQLLNTAKAASLPVKLTFDPSAFSNIPQSTLGGSIVDEVRPLKPSGAKYRRVSESEQARIDRCKRMASTYLPRQAPPNKRHLMGDGEARFLGSPSALESPGPSTSKDNRPTLTIPQTEQNLRSRALVGAALHGDPLSSRAWRGCTGRDDLDPARSQAGFSGWEGSTETAAGGRNTIRPDPNKRYGGVNRRGRKSRAELRLANPSEDEPAEVVDLEPGTSKGRDNDSGVGVPRRFQDRRRLELKRAGNPKASEASGHQTAASTSSQFMDPNEVIIDDDDYLPQCDTLQQLRRTGIGTKEFGGGNTGRSTTGERWRQGTNNLTCAKFSGDSDRLFSPDRKGVPPRNGANGFVENVDSGLELLAHISGDEIAETCERRPRAEIGLPQMIATNDFSQPPIPVVDLAPSGKVSNLRAVVSNQTRTIKINGRSVACKTVVESSQPVSSAHRTLRNGNLYDVTVEKHYQPNSNLRESQELVAPCNNYSKSSSGSSGASGNRVLTRGVRRKADQNVESALNQKLLNIESLPTADAKHYEVEKSREDTVYVDCDPGPRDTDFSSPEIPARIGDVSTSFRNVTIRSNPRHLSSFPRSPPDPPPGVLDRKPSDSFDTLDFEHSTPAFGGENHRFDSLKTGYCGSDNEISNSPNSSKISNRSNHIDLKKDLKLKTAPPNPLTPISENQGPGNDYSKSASLSAESTGTISLSASSSASSSGENADRESDDGLLDSGSNGCPRSKLSSFSQSAPLNPRPVRQVRFKSSLDGDNRDRAKSGAGCYEGGQFWSKGLEDEDPLKLASRRPVILTSSTEISIGSRQLDKEARASFIPTEGLVILFRMRPSVSQREIVLHPIQIRRLTICKTTPSQSAKWIFVCVGEAAEPEVRKTVGMKEVDKEHGWLDSRSSEIRERFISLRLVGLDAQSMPDILTMAQAWKSQYPRLVVNVMDDEAADEYVATSVGKCRSPMSPPSYSHDQAEPHPESIFDKSLRVVVKKHNKPPHGENLFSTINQMEAHSSGSSPDSVISRSSERSDSKLSRTNGFKMPLCRPPIHRYPTVRDSSKDSVSIKRQPGASESCETTKKSRSELSDREKTRSAHEKIRKSNRLAKLEPEAEKKLQYYRLFTYPEGEQGAVTITEVDHACLEPEVYLNDAILDFYLKYTLLNVCPVEERSRYHLFSCFFWKRLNGTKHETSSSQKGAYEEILNVEQKRRLKAKERHDRVSSWTKSVDIFAKDFIIVPINELSHWYLAIIVFPGNVAQHPRNCPENNLFDSIASPNGRGQGASSSAVPSLSNPELDSEEEVAGTPETGIGEDSSGRATIIIMDSLAEGYARKKTVGILRDYLSCEWAKRKQAPHAHRLEFSPKTIPGSFPTVPSQSNCFDCGIYVLQFFESFVQKPDEVVKEMFSIKHQPPVGEADLGLRKPEVPKSRRSTVYDPRPDGSDFLPDLTSGWFFENSDDLGSKKRHQIRLLIDSLTPVERRPGGAIYLRKHRVEPDGGICNADTEDSDGGDESDCVEIEEDTNDYPRDDDRGEHSLATDRKKIKLKCENLDASDALFDDDDDRECNDEFEDCKMEFEDIDADLNNQRTTR